jgi:hypothetical protein
MSNPAKYYEIAAKYVLRYLRFLDLYIRYRLIRERQEYIIGYTDLSYADDINIKRSTLGYIYMLDGGAIS